MTKRHYRTLREITEERFLQHPEELDDYLAMSFAEYAQDGCTAALLSDLRMVARIKGVSELARSTGITRNGIQKALSENGNPKLESLNAILIAMGYCLIPQKLQNLNQTL